MPVVSHRLTVVPAAFFAMKFLSRSSFINLAMRSSAKSQETCLNSLVPGARYFGDLQARRRVHDIEQRRALRAQCAAVHRMIRIALDVDDVGRGVLGAIAKAVDQNPASDRAIGAGVAGLGGGRQLERAGPRLRVLRPAKPKPRASRLDAARVAPVSLTNPRRLKSIVTPSTEVDSLSGHAC